MIEFNNSSKFLRKAIQTVSENKNSDLSPHIAFENFLTSNKIDASHFSYKTRRLPVSDFIETLLFAPRPERTGILLGHIKLHTSKDYSPITLNFYINNKGLWFINMAKMALITVSNDMFDHVLPEGELSICHPDNPVNTVHARAIKNFSTAYDNLTKSFDTVHFKKLIATLWETKDIDLNFLALAYQFFSTLQDDKAQGLKAQFGRALCAIFDNDSFDKLSQTLQCVENILSKNPKFDEALEVQKYFKEAKTKQDTNDAQRKTPTYIPSESIKVPAQVSSSDGVFKIPPPPPRRPKQ